MILRIQRWVSLKVRTRETLLFEEIKERGKNEGGNADTVEGPVNHSEGRSSIEKKGGHVRGILVEGRIIRTDVNRWRNWKMEWNSCRKLGMRKYNR
eukprot:g38940.t1